MSPPYSPVTKQSVAKATLLGLVNRSNVWINGKHSPRPASESPTESNICVAFFDLLKSGNDARMSRNGRVDCHRQWYKATRILWDKYVSVGY